MAENSTECRCSLLGLAHYSGSIPLCCSTACWMTPFPACVIGDVGGGGGRGRGWGGRVGAKTRRQNRRAESALRASPQTQSAAIAGDDQRIGKPVAENYLTRRGVPFQSGGSKFPTPGVEHGQ